MTAQATKTVRAWVIRRAIGILLVVMVFMLSLNMLTGLFNEGQRTIITRKANAMQRQGNHNDVDDVLHTSSLFLYTFYHMRSQSTSHPPEKREVTTFQMLPAVSSFARMLPLKKMLPLYNCFMTANR